MIKLHTLTVLLDGWLSVKLHDVVFDPIPSVQKKPVITENGLVGYTDPVIGSTIIRYGRADRSSQLDELLKDRTIKNHDLQAKDGQRGFATKCSIGPNGASIQFEMSGEPQWVKM
jgi:hypothetical protein